MTQAGQVEHFCEIAKAKKKSEITIIEVGYQGGFTVYDLQSENGKVEVDKTYYKYEEGSIQRKLSCRQLGVYKRGLFDIFRRLVFRRNVRTYTWRGRRTYCITCKAAGRNM